jgi:phosphoenolpyruvate synthase/pyruvate phosphate dikinase
MSEHPIADVFAHEQLCRNGGDHHVTIQDIQLVWLGEPAATDIALVGAKAANLGRLAESHNVPAGFCLTAAALDQDYTEADGLPDRLYQEVVQAYTALAEKTGERLPPVAVRSSAIDEDSGNASFAGQHETYLNIRGADSVARAIVRCWRSLFSERALEYRRQRGVALEGARLAVLVQKLVMADAAAVVFSANPVTKSRDQVVLNASWGLGESLVGGTVSPDSYTLRKSDLAMEMRYIATKRRMTVLTEDGTQEVAVPEGLQNTPAIDDGQVVDAARLALDLEQRFGWPVDVECAWEKGGLYLLQCRPITTV